MTTAYVDTSAIVAILFAEPGAKAARKILAKADVFSATLLEAEVWSTLCRESLPTDVADELLAGISFVNPPTVRAECAQALAHGYLRGADLFHVAVALALVGETSPAQLAFVSFDEHQRSVAASLGFRVAPSLGH